MATQRTDAASDVGHQRARQRASWMARAQAGDQQAYQLLLESVLSELRGFLRRRIRDADDAEDVVQEVLLAVHRARHTYDPERPFEPWLFAIARNVAVDWLRSRHVRRRVELVGADAATFDAAGEQAGEISLEGALASLPDAQREALEMVKIEGLTMEQAAARSGVSPGALRVRIHRGYLALRRRLSGSE